MRRRRRRGSGEVRRGVGVIVGLSVDGDANLRRNCGHGEVENRMVE